MILKNKYNLTLEQNVFLAKRNIVDNIYSNARMEGVNVTFSQTKTILEGVNVPNLKIDEIQVILNLRDAWNYVINNVKKILNLDFICKVNEYVARNESLEWGTLRNRKSINYRNKLYSRHTNKRTSMIVANKIMIENGAGIIKVSDEYLEKFNQLLSDFYTTNNKEKIKAFIFKNCIDGIEF